MTTQRFIHPKIWNSDDFNQISSDTGRLLFMGCFSTADDEGRRKASGRSMKGDIFPQRVDITFEQVEVMRDELAALGMIRLYTSESGELLLDVPTWSEHQNPKYKKKSKLEPFDQSRQVFPKLEKIFPNPPDLGQISEISQKSSHGLGRVGLESGLGSGLGNSSLVAPRGATEGGAVAQEEPKTEVEKDLTKTIAEKLPEVQKKLDEDPYAPSAVSMEFMMRWNSLPSPIKKIARMTPERNRKLKTRLKDQFWKDNWIKAIERIPKSDFLMGREKSWKADPDWFLSSGTPLQKIIECQYSGLAGCAEDLNITGPWATVLGKRVQVQRDKRGDAYYKCPDEGVWKQLQEGTPVMGEEKADGRAGSAQGAKPEGAGCQVHAEGNRLEDPHGGLPAKGTGAADPAGAGRPPGALPGGTG